MEFIDKSYAFIKTAVNTALDLSNEKTVVIKTLNNLFKEQYVSGATDRLVVASITKGERSYKHSMSTYWLRSGFTLTIQNDDDLTLQEAQAVAGFILGNKSFIRQLMTLGFDTLFVKGKDTHSIKFKISDKQESDIPVVAPSIHEHPAVSKAITTFEAYSGVFTGITIIIIVIIIIAGIYFSNMK